jgi:hypothetical protein
MIRPPDKNVMTIKTFKRPTLSDNHVSKSLPTNDEE